MVGPACGNFADGLGLVSSNDEEACRDGNGVLNKSDDKVGHLERSHQAGAPLIARESSCDAAGSAEDSAKGGSLSS